MEKTKLTGGAERIMPSPGKEKRRAFQRKDDMTQILQRDAREKD